MRCYHFLGMVALLVILVPVASADEIAGQSVVVQVTDQNKHTAPTQSEVTFLDYQFSFSGSAPSPADGNPADAVGRAWLLLNVDHEYHTGQTFPRDVVEDQSISYKITFNGMVIQYDTTIHAEDSGWDLVRLADSINPFTHGPDAIGERGFVMEHFLVYNASSVLVADETETEPIYTLNGGGIPNTYLWLDYENSTLTITPQFIAHGLMPQYLLDAPATTAGQVAIQNATYQTLEIQVTADKTLEDVTLAYGFGRSGASPDYTLGSLLHDAATSVGSLLGGVVNGIVDFVFKFVPYGDKILFLKDFVGTLIGALWEVLLQDPVMLVEDVFLVAVMYGLLLFIDPLFKHIFTPLWALAKGLWKCVVGIWVAFLWIVRFIVSKIPTGGG